MSSQEYFKMSPYVSTRMPGEIAEIMTEISDSVVEKMGELSILRSVAEELPPVQEALLLSSLETPGFRIKAARKKYDALRDLPSKAVSHEKRLLEEMLYEKGITATWFVDHSTRFRKHELVVYYVKEKI